MSLTVEDLTSSLDKSRRVSSQGKLISHFTTSAKLASSLDNFKIYSSLCIFCQTLLCLFTARSPVTFTAYKWWKLKGKVVCRKEDLFRVEAISVSLSLIKFLAWTLNFH